MKNIKEFFSDWDGWYCNICGDVIGNVTKDLQNHLKENHKIEVNLE